MSEFSITIPVSAYKAFDPSVQQAIMSYVVAQFGVPLAAPVVAPIAEGRDEKGLA